MEYKIGRIYERRDYPVYTNELDVVKNGDKPICKIAGRKVFQLKVLKNKTGKNIIAFLIAGSDISEKILVYLERQPEFNLITKVKIIRKATCDQETGTFLCISLLHKLAKKVEFAPNIIPKYNF
jgi:hypothetical protein